VRWLLVAASVVPSSPILVTLMKEALGSWFLHCFALLLNLLWCQLCINVLR
jgi:hypothetical protein